LVDFWDCSESKKELEVETKGPVAPRMTQRCAGTFIESIRVYRRYLSSAPSTISLLRHIQFECHGLSGKISLLIHILLYFDILLRPIWGDDLARIFFGQHNSFVHVYTKEC